MFARLKRDIQAVLDRDPAARSVLEVILCYPGLHALWLHRIAHWLWTHDLKLLARMVSNLSRWLTLIEIHPGARIGEGFFIDHGAGVVIGETAQIGDNVTLYQGVTLGGTGKEKGKRHPTIGNNVVIGTGARILGAITVGDNCKIGAGAVALRDVPPDCTVVGNPGRIVRRSGQKVDLLDHVNLPDPVAAALDQLTKEVHRLQAKVKNLEAELALIRARGEPPEEREDVPRARTAAQ